MIRIVYLRAAALGLLLPGLPVPEPARGGAHSGGPTVNDMIAAIVADARETAAYTGRPELDERVLEALREVPRDRFVPDREASRAWRNQPLSIGYGQTISQPFVVALMTDLLEPAAGYRILEIGTGSGYQAAVLARLSDHVHTVEIVPELAERSARVLEHLGYDNVSVHTGDGWYGWPNGAPYDGIIVTAVAERIPPKLLEQLAPGGRMVLPLGPSAGYQELVLVERDPDGEVSRRPVLPVQFVPLTGDHPD